MDEIAALKGRDDMLVAYPVGKQTPLGQALGMLRERKWAADVGSLADWWIAPTMTAFAWDAVRPLTAACGCAWRRARPRGGSTGGAATPHVARRVRRAAGVLMLRTLVDSLRSRGGQPKGSSSTRRSGTS